MEGSNNEKKGRIGNGGKCKKVRCRRNDKKNIGRKHRGKKERMGGNHDGIRRSKRSKEEREGR